MSYQRLLTRLCESRELVIIERELLGEAIWGCVLDVGPNLALVADLASNQFNGYSIVRIEDITELDWGTPTLVGRKLGVGDPEPPAVRVELAHFRAVLSSLSRAGAVMTVRRESLRSTAVVGRSVEFQGELALITPITVEGNEGGCVALSTGDITRVDFRSSYELAFERALGRRVSRAAH